MFSGEEMCCRSGYPRLCRLVDDSLRPYTEQDMIPITKEKERDVLILLSQVSRQIHRLRDEAECDPGTEFGFPTTIDGVCSKGSKSHPGNHDCLARIVYVLVSFLTSESQHVQHLAGNILVVISNIIAKSGQEWAEFLHLLCACTEAAISKIHSSSMISSTTKPEFSGCDKSDVWLLIQPILVKASWTTVAALVHVIRNILKYLKQEKDGELAEIYLHTINCFLSDVPWDLLGDVLIDQMDDSVVNCRQDVLISGNIIPPRSRFLFLGNLLQFFCSIVEQIDLVEIATGSSVDNPAFGTITSLVPKLLHWCSYKKGGYNSRCISYLRHKILMLMIRLSLRIHWETSILVLWLQLLRKYFQDLLHQPIVGHQDAFDDCLEGSPFLASVADGVNSICSSHLQRQAVFLFLKCCFSLISLGKETDKKCACVNSDVYLITDLTSGVECCVRRKGLFELSEWLLMHLPIEQFVNFRIYMDKCRNFSRSFLQLYMHEDDFLFEVLLQLLSLPSPADQLDQNKQGKTFEEVKGDVYFLLSSVFNPVNLFHMFLAELHYDHLVLLDYLISKDTGTSCLQYLLRCLRAVCNSWNMFVEFSLFGDLLTRSHCKKRKVCLGSPNSYVKVELSSAPVDGCRTAVTSENECRSNHNLVDGNIYDRREQPFEKAKGCILSLKKFVENLHQKNLFPYNPTVLLRSFKRFQELCH